MTSSHSEGLYYTDTPKILFSMIDSQADVAFEPGNGEAFADGLLLQCIGALAGVHTHLIENVHRCREMYYGELGGSGEASERPVEIPSLATEDLLENTDGSWSTPSVFSCGGTMLPSVYADARCIDAVIVSKARGCAVLDGCRRLLGALR